MNKKYFPNKAKPIALIISTIFFTSNTFAAHPLFAKVPGAMQTEIQDKTIPNILLSIDNSGSMTSSSGTAGVNRMESVRAAVLGLFDLRDENGDYLFRDKFRWGLSAFNHQTEFGTASPVVTWQMPIKNATTGAVTMSNVGSSSSSSYGTILVPVRDPSNAHITEIQNRVRQLRASGGTPLMQSAYRAYHHFSTDPEVIQYRCQSNNLIIVGDGEASYTTAHIAQAATTDFIMEGQPGSRTTNDYEGSGFDSRPFDKQTVKTSTIGYGNTDIYALQQIATYGNGVYVRVNSTAELAAGLRQILSNIAPFKGYATVPTNQAGDALSVDATTKTVAITLDGNGWVSLVQVSELKADPNNNDSKIIDPTKTQRYAYHDGTNGRVYISTPDGVRPFNTTATSNSITFNNASFDLPSTVTTAWSTWVQWVNAPQYKSNDSSLTVSDMALRNRGSYSPYDTSPKNIGDVMDSSVLLLGNIYKYDNVNLPRFLVFGSNDGMVKIYSANTTAYPYLFRFGYIPGTAKRENGRTIMTDLKIRSQSNYGSYNNPHEYYVNGGIAARETENGHLFIVGTLGQGGKAAYALNIGGKDHKSGAVTGIGTLDGNGPTTGATTNEALWRTSVPLWDTSSDKFGEAYDTDLKLGYTISSPIIARVALNRDAGGKPRTDKDIRYTAFMPNGYEGAAATPTLYLLDALGLNVGLDTTSSPPSQKNLDSTEGKGGLLHTFSAPAVSGGTKNGLSSPAVVDIDFDNIIDLVYAGDLNGNVYRFDLRGKTPADWTSTLLYKGDPSQPITAAPVVHLSGSNEVTVIFGTGSNIYNTDFEDMSTQTLYGIKDNIAFLKPAQAPLSYADRESSTGLLLQEFTDLGLTGNNVKIRGASRNKMTKNHKGWFIDMKTGGSGTGERIVHQPVMLGSTVFFTSLSLKPMDAIDPNIMCGSETGGAFGAVMTLDAATGGMPTSRQPNNNNKLKLLPTGITEIAGYVTTSPTSALSSMNTDTNEQDANGLVKRVAKSLPLVYVNNSNTSSPGQYIGDEWVNSIIGVDTTRVNKECKRGSGPSKGSGMSLTGADGGTELSGINCGYSDYPRRLSWREIF